MPSATADLSRDTVCFVLHGIQHCGSRVTWDTDEEGVAEPSEVPVEPWPLECGEVDEVNSRRAGEGLVTIGCASYRVNFTHGREHYQKKKTSILGEHKNTRKTQRHEKRTQIFKMPSATADFSRDTVCFVLHGIQHAHGFPSCKERIGVKDGFGFETVLAKRVV